MNLKQAKKIRKDLAETGWNIVDIVYGRLPNTPVSSGRQKYQKAKEEFKANPVINSPYRPTHGMGVPSASKESNFKGFTEKGAKWRAHAKNVIYEERPLRRFLKEQEELSKQNGKPKRTPFHS
jgi:hypothetical protein